MSITPASMKYSQDILGNIFSFCSSTENMNNAQVCKSWKEIAIKIERRKLIPLLKSIEEKSKGFLSMVPGKKLEELCPDFHDALEKSSEKKNATIKEIHECLNKLSKKHIVCLAGCFIIDPNSPNIPEDNREDFAGKAFAEFHYTDPNGNNWDGTPNRICLWQEIVENSANKWYFPIGIFGLEVKEGQLVGEKDKGDYCYVFKGRLVTLSLELGEEDVRNSRFLNNKIFREKPGVLEFAAPGTFGIVRKREIYIPRLHAAPENSSETK